MFPITCIFIQNTSTFNIQNIRPVKIAPLKSPETARNGIFGATFFLGWENYRFEAPGARQKNNKQKTRL